MSSSLRSSAGFKRVTEQLRAVAESALVQQQQTARANAKALGKPTEFTLPLNLRHSDNVASALENVAPKHYDAFSTFLENQNEYKQLLIRYQGADVDSPERVKLSANRVGLDLPDIK